MKPVKDISYYEQEIDKSRKRWEEIRVNGCSDPFWPDGVNMNLCRNHVIYYLHQIADLEQKPLQLSMFEEMAEKVDVMNDKRIPPLVDNNYMADGTVVGPIFRRQMK